jgi:methylenetetrahydrofolate dehydrogenase (NADP+)/methenyltetrahydrofolate cyclohydrolase
VADLAAQRVQATLGTVLVSDDGPSRRAMAAKHHHAAQAGIRIVAVDLPVSVGQAELEAAVTALATDPDVHGIFLQLPLPDHLDTARVIDLIPAAADIDGLRPDSPFLPAMTDAVMRLLQRQAIDPVGRDVLVVSDSPFIAAPLRRIDPAAPDFTAACAKADVVVDATAPGGIGPVTIALLLEHTARAAGVGH